MVRISYTPATDGLEAKTVTAHSGAPWRHHSGGHPRLPWSRGILPGGTELTISQDAWWFRKFLGSPAFLPGGGTRALHAGRDARRYNPGQQMRRVPACVQRQWRIYSAQPKASEDVWIYF